MRAMRASSVLLLFVLSMLLAACGGGSDEVTASPTAAAAADSLSATSGEVVLTLEVADGALSDGAASEAILVEPIEAAIEGQAEGIELAAAFSLSPSGLTFTEPVAAVFDVPLDEGLQYIVLLASEDGEIVALDSSEVRRVGDNGDRATIRVSVPHFSRVWLLGNRGFVTTQSPTKLDDSYEVGESFDLLVTVTRKRLSEEILILDADHEVRDAHVTGAERQNDRWAVLYRWDTRNPSGPIRPNAEPPDAEDRLRFDASGDAEVEITQTFTCVAPGKFNVHVIGKVVRWAKITVFVDDGFTEEFQWVGSGFWRSWWDGLCVAPGAPAPSASVTSPPASPLLVVPQIGSAPATAVPPSLPPEAPPVSGVIAPGSYAVVFSGERVGTCGFQAVYTTKISLEVRDSPARDGFHDLTFFDGQTRAEGVINAQTGEFSDVGGQYSGTLTDDFRTPQQITRTLQTATCVATYTITVTAQ